MNRIAKVINSLGNDKFKFVPDKKFYESVQIGRKRWAQLFRNEKSPNIDELMRIAQYFNISINEFFESKKPTLN